MAGNASGVIMSDVALLHIARRVDAIVLQVDWRRYSEQLFVRAEDQVDTMFRELLKQHPRSLQASFTVGVRQLLCASLLKALETQVFVNGYGSPTTNE